jgi:hypothetical protein
MRFCALVLIGGFALASSAFAGNIALSSLNAGASCGGTGVQPCNLTGYGPGGAIDGLNNTSLWVAPGSSLAEPANTYVPYLEVDLSHLTGITNPYVDWVTVSGWGNLRQQITYDIFVGTDPNVGDYYTNSSGVVGQSFSGGCATAGACAGIIINTTQAGNGNYPNTTLTSSGQWTSTQYTDPLAVTDYIFYVVVGSQADQAGHTNALYDDAYTSGIVADDPNVPEPGTFGMLGAGLLALGFAWRSRK